MVHVLAIVLTRGFVVFFLSCNPRCPGESLSNHNRGTFALDHKPEIGVTWYDVTTDPVFLVVPSNMTVHVGSTILLECSVKDPGSADIHWLRDNKPFPYASRDPDAEDQSEEEYEYASPEARITHKMAASGALQIFNTRLADAGLYSCVATSAAGQATAHAYLGVTGRFVTSSVGFLVCFVQLQWFQVPGSDPQKNFPTWAQPVEPNPRTPVSTGPAPTPPPPFLLALPSWSQWSVVALVLLFWHLLALDALRRFQS